MTHNSVLTSFYASKFEKIDKYGEFSCDTDYSNKTDVFRGVLSPIQLINVTPGAQRAPLVDTLCPPAARRKQTKRACNIIKVD